MSPELCQANTLNELNGREWLLFTKSWLVLNPAPRHSKAFHPACFPEELASGFIEFFTKKGDWVLDPFLGSGTTLVAAKRLSRNGLGIEVYQKYAKFAKKRLTEEEKVSGVESIIHNEDSRRILELFKDNNFPEINFCFTSPPYWNQLLQKHRRQRSRSMKNLPTTYGRKQSDLGNISDYEEFLTELMKVFDGVYDVMLNNSYLVLVCNNIYKNGRIWPLAFDMFRLLSKRWVPKDERIWCQDNKHLHPFGIFRKWIANRCHHYCLVFKKEY